MAEATITIGMPVFNNADTLARAVQSVQAQSREDWRMIITDDCSSDNSFAIAKSLAERDTRIEAIRNEYRLVFQNFAKSLSMADTPYFTWLAADDYWGPRFLELAAEALATNPEAVSALPACQFIDASGGPYLPSLTMPKAERIRTYLRAPGGTRMYGLGRTDIVRRAFPKRTMHAYDWHLMLGILNAGPQITLPDKQLYRRKTPVAAYAEDAERQTGFFKWFPVLDMSIAAIRAGHLPWRSGFDLLRLNLRKHEEFVAYRRPRVFTRMQPVYGLLGLPISNSPEMMRELAKGDPATKPRARVSAEPKHPPRLVALVTCRNAAPTLSRLLKNLHAHGAEAIVIDNGSTDDTRAIAEAAKGSPVTAIHDDPFDGAFDLTRQLRLKRALIRSITADWIIHADADEFLDSPDGQPLRSFLAGIPDHTVAFVCDEKMYLPLGETDRHLPETFEETMRAHVRMIERNAKERVFRASANLDRWMATGGHSVTDGGLSRARQTLPLRHYFALSLDQVRSEYLSRIYAAHDLAKFWHGARRTEAVNIVAPPHGLLVDHSPKAVRSIPVFAPRRMTGRTRAPTGSDLALAADSHIAEEVKGRIARAIPDVRIFTGLGPTSLPHLHVVAHPAHYIDPKDVEGAENWLRGIAELRQHILTTNAPIAELRYEDLDTIALRGCLSRLLLGKGTGFARRQSLEVKGHPAFQGRLKAITAGLAVDLAYT